MIQITSNTTLPAARLNELRETAQQLETTFTTEMLKATGLGKPVGGLNGGIGEEQFSSFRLEQQAAALVQAGGFGLTEALFQSLVRSEGQT
ncbi:rod-binding protein [Donghicola eburneus]|uniref:Flagellar protein FlgJ N-terminal domain-containing protein n=1 Tax=Donghicola eburneus TaxID=393278 RepID=A0A1M4N3R0_9RHOB|nr:rod-binding protein [Donghicola eburneus]SCM69471.1 hypothetical protein KARMA_3710 [Donghicola eburneus]SFQ47021.1 Rod binding protein [Donghicola eburneus]